MFVQTPNAAMVTTSAVVDITLSCCPPPTPCTHCGVGQTCCTIWCGPRHGCEGLAADVLYGVCWRPWQSISRSWPLSYVLNMLPTTCRQHDCRWGCGLQFWWLPAPQCQEQRSRPLCRRSGHCDLVESFCKALCVCATSLFWSQMLAPVTCTWHPSPNITPADPFAVA
jgi:hypothetical protein